MPATNATRVLVSVASMTCKGRTSMQIAMRADGKRAVARLSGRFEVSAHREFRETIDAALRNDDIEEVVIDLAEVVYIDSSALGMLLMLREKANGARKKLAPCQSAWRCQAGIGYCPLRKALPHRLVRGIFGAPTMMPSLPDNGSRSWWPMIHS
jgi:anti-anti-sigma factor